MMKFISIVLLCVVLSIFYGVVHDNVTARLCIEYFTVGHPIIVNTADPTLIALIWGIVATWWVGAAMGVLVALAARVGKLPKLEPNELIRPLMRLLVSMGCFAACVGFLAHAILKRIPIAMPAGLANRIPPEHQHWFFVDLYIHNASYLAGICGALVVCCCALITRYRKFVSQSLPDEHRLNRETAP